MTIEKPAETPRARDAPTEPKLVEALRRDGFVRLAARETRALLGPAASWWDAFAETWDDLGVDRYMADGGRYRQRRHAVFHVRAGQIDRQAHQPHYQSRDYNPLNGGVERWFEAVLMMTASHPIMRRMLKLGDRLFSAADGYGNPPCWKVEIHQFRIEAADQAGRPTPEGFHRDGVDWVMVMLIDRRNVADGVTQIGLPDGQSLGEFTLRAPGDAVFLDDRRVLHEVTPIHRISTSRAAHRDVLVITFSAPQDACRTPAAAPLSADLPYS